MKAPRRLVRALVPAALALGCLAAWPQPAQADTFDDLMTALSYVPGYGDHAQSIKESRELFVCIAEESGKTALDCVAEHADGPLANDIMASGGVPSWVQFALEGYVCIRQQDFYCAVAKFGLAAACAVGQALCGGYDVCGLVMAIIEAAKTVWEGLEQLWAWAKDAYCATLGEIFGGCDDDSVPMPVFFYKVVFEAQVGAGMGLKESGNNADFEAKVSALVAQALAYAENYMHPFGGAAGLSSDIQQAAQIYRDAVEKAWTGDIVPAKLDALTQQRAQYATPGKLGAIASAADTHGISPDDTDKGLLRAFAIDSCSSDFGGNADFAAVDRWIKTHASDAKKLSALTNADWCTKKLWVDHYKDIATALAAIYWQKICLPEVLGKRSCDSVEAYGDCAAAASLLGNDPAQCAMNVSAAGNKIAEGIKQYLAAKGGKPEFACSVKKATGTNVGIYIFQPVNLNCPRPNQKHWCKKGYAALYRDHPIVVDGQPLELVECTVTEDPSYAALANQVASAVAQINSEYGDAGGPVAGIGEDRLLVIVKPAIEGKLAQAKKSYGVPTGFKYQIVTPNDTVDGVFAPTIASDVSQAELLGPEKVTKPDFEKQIGSLKELGTHPDPRVVNPDSALDTHGLAGQIPGKAALPAGGIAVVAPSAKGAAGAGAGAVPGVGAAKMAGGPLAPGGVGPGAVGGTTQPMMGTLPSDITSGEQVVIAGQPVRWGSTIIVDASRALTRNVGRSGLCGFAVETTARNLGLGVTHGFASVWTNSAVAGRWPHNWMPLEPQGARTERDILALKPGDNPIQLVLDDMNQVQESNENNNTFRVKVSVTGSCAAAVPVSVPGAPAPAVVRPPVQAGTPAVTAPATGIRVPVIVPAGVATPTPGRVSPPATTAPIVIPSELAKPLVTPTPAGTAPTVPVPGRISAPVLQTPTPTPTPTPRAPLVRRR